MAYDSPPQTSTTHQTELQQLRSTLQTEFEQLRSTHQAELEEQAKAIRNETNTELANTHP